MKKYLFVFIIISLSLLSCDNLGTNISQPKSSSGVSKTNVTVPTGIDGLTVEQENVKNRLLEDNKPGAIKHLYIISAYSGQVLMYSTVKGKVTSSGKRLSPTSVSATDGQYVGENHAGIPVSIAGDRKYTSEVLEDDGTYGSSVEYVYWWDSKGVYHQQYITGGMIMHISSQPIAVKSVVLNLEETK